MTQLILGLALLMGPHCVRFIDAGFRDRAVARMGEGAWKGLYSLISLAGLALIAMGFGAARADSPVLWVSPAAAKHAAAALMLLSCVLLAAAFVPGNHFKARVGHPMVLGVKTWAFAHLLANGRLVDVLLFGVFLAWAVALFIALRRADRVAGKTYPAAGVAEDLISVVAGGAVFAGIAFWGHQALFGVSPFTL